MRESGLTHSPARRHPSPPSHLSNHTPPPAQPCPLPPSCGHGRWVAHDWVIISLFWVVLGLRYYLRSLMGGLALRAPFEPDIHYPLSAAADAAHVTNNVLAIECLLVYGKVCTCPCT